MTELPAQQQQFLNEVVPAVVRLHRRTGLPASVVLAQAILESGWGRSPLTSRNKNLFGIKAHRRNASVLYTTTEFKNGKSRRVKARFARYASFDDCLADYARVLSRPRYGPARNAAHDPSAFATQLQRCGYATDPRYAAKLRQLIRKYDLTRYDSAAGEGDP